MIPTTIRQRVLAKLERAVGRAGFHHTVSLGETDDLGDGYHYSAVLTDRDDDTVLAI